MGPRSRRVPISPAHANRKNPATPIRALKLTRRLLGLCGLDHLGPVRYSARSGGYDSTTCCGLVRLLRGKDNIAKRALIQNSQCREEGLMR